jgi:hypothetical protein
VPSLLKKVESSPTGSGICGRGRRELLMEPLWGWRGPVPSTPTLRRGDCEADWANPKRPVCLPSPRHARGQGEFKLTRTIVAKSPLGRRCAVMLAQSLPRTLELGRQSNQSPVTGKHLPSALIASDKQVWSTQRERRHHS